MLCLDPNQDLAQFLTCAIHMDVALGKVSEEDVLLGKLGPCHFDTIPREEIVSHVLGLRDATLSLASEPRPSSPTMELWEGCAERLINTSEAMTVLIGMNHLFCIDALSRTILEAASRLRGAQLALDPLAYARNRRDLKPISSDKFAHDPKLKMSDTGIIKKLNEDFKGILHAYSILSSGIHIDGRSAERRYVDVWRVGNRGFEIKSGYFLAPLPSALIEARMHSCVFFAWATLVKMLDWCLNQPE